MKLNRTRAVRIRVTPEEHAAITAAGEAVGLGLCSFARMATVKAAGLKPAEAPRKKPDAYARALAVWTTELARIGNNLNQCARTLNTGGSLELATLVGIRAELQRLRETVLVFDPGGGE